MNPNNTHVDKKNADNDILAPVDVICSKLIMKFFITQ